MVSCTSLTENVSALSVSTSMPNSNVLDKWNSNQVLYSTQKIRCHQIVLLMQKHNTTIKNSIIWHREFKLPGAKKTSAVNSAF